MSECVVRMEMPKSCRECPFMTGCSYCEGYSDSCVLAPDGVECGWDFFHEEGPTKRPDWCPIICQLPEGHGRLIDADSAYKAACEGADNWDGGCSPYRDDCIREEMDKVPAASPWHRVDEPPKQNGAYAVCWKGSNSWGKLFYCGEWLATPGTPFPDYWMPIEPPKED